MIYIIVILGLILIYFGLKRDDNQGEKKFFNKIFSDVYKKDDIEYIKEELNYILNRIDDIDKSISNLTEMSNLNNENSIESNSPNFSEILNLNLTKDTNDSIDNSLNEESANKNSKVNEINETIYNMYDSGKSIEEISSTLRIGKGEVSLRLGLRK